MAEAPTPAPTAVLLTWLDGMKGISILWIAFFYFYTAYTNNRYPKKNFGFSTLDLRLFLEIET